jgi:hypothetical protein
MNNTSNIINNPTSPTFDITQTLHYLEKQRKENSVGDGDVVGFIEPFGNYTYDTEILTVVMVIIFIMAIYFVMRSRCKMC